jgi:hypothetical protein
MGSGRDKRLKIIKLMGNNFLTTTAFRPIKAINTASSVPKGSRVDQKPIESSKTGKVTTVVAVMTIFCKNKRNLWNANLQNLGKLALNSKKLVLKQTKTRKNSTKMHTVRATKPKTSASRGLTVKEKTIRVPLDSRSSGDLIFLKNGSSKNLSIVRRA